MMEELSEREKLAYLSGIIDGEGNITITKSKYKTYTQYVMRIRVGNTSHDLILWLKNNFGGGISTIGGKEKWKDMRTWEVVSRKAYRILVQVRPYLIIKGKQADLAMDYYRDCVFTKINLHVRYPPLWLNNKREMYYQQMKVLNRRGKWKEVTSGQS